MSKELINKIADKVKEKLSKEPKTEEDWSKMFEHWKKTMNNLRDSLKNLGPPPVPTETDKLKKWQKDYKVLKLNMDALNEEAEQYTQRYAKYLEK